MQDYDASAVFNMLWLCGALLAVFVISFWLVAKFVVELYRRLTTVSPHSPAGKPRIKQQLKECLRHVKRYGYVARGQGRQHWLGLYCVQCWRERRHWPYRPQGGFRLRDGVRVDATPYFSHRVCALFCCAGNIPDHYHETDT